jgi:hypothetical protein
MASATECKYTDVDGKTGAHSDAPPTGKAGRSRWFV